MAIHYPFANLLYRLENENITPDIYHEMSFLFNLYPKEVLWLLRYICHSKNDSAYIASLKFLSDKEIVTKLELDTAIKYMHEPKYSLIFFYSLERQLDGKVLEEMEKLIHDFNVQKDVDALRIMIENSPPKLADIVYRYLREKQINLEDSVYLYSYFLDIGYHILRDKVIDLILGAREYEFDYVYNIIEKLSLSGNVICHRDLIHIYKEHKNVLIKDCVIKNMGNCLSYEAVDFLLNIIHSERRTSRNLAFDSLVHIYNLLLYDDRVNKSVDSSSNRRKITETMIKNQEAFKRLAIDIIDNNSDEDSISSAINLLLCTCDIKKDRDILGRKDLCNFLEKSCNKKISKTLVYKIIEYKNVRHILEYIKTKDRAIIDQIYEDNQFGQSMKEFLTELLDENIDELFNKTLDLILFYNLEDLLEYRNFILEDERLSIKTRLNAIKIMSIVSEVETIEFLSSYIDECKNAYLASFLLLYLYQMNKEMGTKNAKNIIDVASGNEIYQRTVLHSSLIILFMNEDPPSISFILERINKIKPQIDHNILKLLKYLNKNILLESLFIIYLKTKDIRGIFEMLRELDLDFVQEEDVYNYFLFNCGGKIEGEPTFMLIEGYNKCIIDKNSDEDFVII
ncbi:MAG: hypothetical protein NZM04_00590 [Methylacidiphilales bacterium]|nr:hypothetical protein [Candidatus Methylacidiphilales bacterium]